MIDDSWTDEDRQRQRVSTEAVERLLKAPQAPTPYAMAEGSRAVLTWICSDCGAETDANLRDGTWHTCSDGRPWTAMSPGGAQPVEQASGEESPPRGWLPIASHQIVRGARVLVYAGGMRVATHDGYGWELDEGGYCQPTLWMPVQLP